MMEELWIFSNILIELLLVIKNVSMYSFSDLCCHIRFKENVPLTSNICEGYYRGLNMSFEQKYPEINTFLQELQTRDYNKEPEIVNAITKQNHTIVSDKYKKPKEIFEMYESYYDYVFLTSIAAVYNWKFH
jgi:hypothetical protein